ncbi:copper homeostasis protein CutC [Hutsoniella sourekii]
MKLEFCAENFTDIPRKIDQGASRIELCDNLAQGGTTPSYGVIKHSLAYCQTRGIPVMVMVRCRGGNFNYNQWEKQIMLDDAKLILELGANGLVCGGLIGNQLDTDLLESLSRLAQSYQAALTCHMAFDQLSKDQQLLAIDQLAQMGFQRILTHGGPMEAPILDHVEWLSQLIDYANQRIVMMPGGGITRYNLADLHACLQVKEYHGSRIV